MRETTNTKRFAQTIIKRISNKVEKDKKEPVGNQNCLLCTWCTEAQFRGIDILPRPVYSPRDVIFKFTDANIVKYARKIHFRNENVLKQKVLKGKRFYCHVNWKGSSGGHEFILLNIDGKIYVMDSQAGLLADIDSDDGGYYFRDINYKNSFIVRLDNKELNEDILKYNSANFTMDFDEIEDSKYLL